MSVFLLLVLTGMLLATAVVVELAAERTLRSNGDAALRLAGQSVLSEYSRELKERYGLFALTNGKEGMEKRAASYVSASLKKDKGAIDVVHGNVKSLELDFSAYALTNPDILEEQIVQCMKRQIGIEGVKVITEGAAKEENSGFGILVEGKDVAETDREGVLRRRSVIEALPSTAFSVRGIELPDLDELPSLDNLWEEGTNSFLVNYYLLTFFHNQLANKGYEDSFFQNEVEYILCGKRSDKANGAETEALLLALRSAIDLAYIYQTPEKKAEIQALAEILTPGPEAAATQAILALAWSAAEGANDVARLMDGGCVPLMKTEEDWMISLEAAWEKMSEGITESPVKEEGLNYKGYLMVLLCMESREAKLVRAMDLIQLNMQGLFDAGFRMESSYAGVRMDVVLARSGRLYSGFGARTGTFCLEFAYDKAYQRTENGNVRE